MNEYGLSEVWVPEERHLTDEKEKAGGKCNIFMSEEFRTGKGNGRAMILMQGGG